MFVTPNVILNYKNSRGLTITLAPFTEMWVEKCEEILMNDIISEKQSGLHGETYVADSMSSRTIALSGFFNLFNPVNTMEYWKSVIERVFNPTIPGILTYSNTKTNEHRYIECRVNSVANVRWERRKPRFDIELTALSPFWQGVELTEIIALLIKKGRFPLVIPKKEGFVFGVRENTLQSQFANAGDIATGFRAVIRARTGTVINPWIENKETGDKVKILYAMNKNDVIEILCYPHKKQVTLNKTESAMKYLDPDNYDFFNLELGDNIVGYNADENTSNMEVVIYYTPLYLGV